MRSASILEVRNVSMFFIGTIRERGGVDKFAESFEPDQFVFESWKARVKAAGVGQNENARAGNHFCLCASSGSCSFTEEIAIDAQTHECHDFRPQPRYLRREYALALFDFVATEFSCRARRARTQ